MKESNKKWIILTTVICLLPTVVGMALYGRLPDEVPTHFDFNGVANGWSPKAFAVFGMPAFMVGLNLLVYFMLNTDPKKYNMNPAMRVISFAIVPVVSLLAGGLILATAMGCAVQVAVVTSVMVGVLFILVGNYLPKTKQSYTMGFRLAWTLNSEENWNRTHRLAGILWVVGGVAFILISLLNCWNSWLFGVILGGMVVVPSAYSYLLYKKGI